MLGANIKSENIGLALNETLDIMKNLGPSLFKFSAKLVNLISKIDIAKINKTITVISVVVDIMSQMLDLKDDKQTTKDIGIKAEEMEKEDIKPENFDSYEEYVEDIKNKNSDEKVSDLSPEDEIKYNIVGFSILAKLLEETMKVEIPAEFIVEIGRQDLNAKEAIQFIQVFKERNLSLKYVSSYLSGTIENDKYCEVGQAIEDVVKCLNPNMSEEEIGRKIDQMRYNARM